MMLPFDCKYLCQEPDGSIRLGGAMPAAILAGSFNPLHDGHRHLAQIVVAKLGRPVAFEMSILNVDKPEFDSAEIRRRLAQFLGLAPVFVTRARTFEQKAELFPGAVMVVGTDTAERIVSPRYYGDDVARRDRSLATIRERGCRFLVAGRTHSEGRFVTLSDVVVPEQFGDLFEGFGEHEFRIDVSSTQLRQARRSAND